MSKTSGLGLHDRPLLPLYIGGECQDDAAHSKASESGDAGREPFSWTARRGNFLQSCLSKAAWIVEDALPDNLRPRFSSIQPHAPQPHAAKLGFSSQSSSLWAIIPPGITDWQNYCNAECAIPHSEPCGKGPNAIACQQTPGIPVVSPQKACLIPA